MNLKVGENLLCGIRIINNKISTVMETMVVVNGMTAHRANVIAARTGSAAMGIIKAQMINLLKEKLKNGIAHFLYKKQSTQ